MIVMEPIGEVRNTHKDLSDDDWGAVASRIELLPSFAEDCLLGLEEFSHAEVLFHFDRVQDAAIVRGARHPRGNKSWPPVGIFAQRGKDRPNRLGSTMVEILGREGRSLRMPLRRGGTCVSSRHSLERRQVWPNVAARQLVAFSNGNLFGFRRVSRLCQLGGVRKHPLHLWPLYLTVLFTRAFR